MSEKLQKGRHKDGGSQSSQQELLNLEGAAATPSRTSDSSEQNPGLGASKRLDSNLLNTAVPQSDAILSCPACMSTLCLDCQRYALCVLTEYLIHLISLCSCSASA